MFYVSTPKRYDLESECYGGEFTGLPCIQNPLQAVRGLRSCQSGTPLASCQYDLPTNDCSSVLETWSGL